LSAITVQSLFAAYPHVNSNQNFRQGQVFYDYPPYDENQYPSSTPGEYHQVYGAGIPQSYPLNENYNDQNTPPQYRGQSYGAAENYDSTCSPAGNYRYPHQQPRYNNHWSHNDAATHESVHQGEGYPSSENDSPWFTPSEQQGNPLTSYRYQSSYESKRAIGDNSNDIPPSKQQNKNPSDQGNPLTSYRYQSSYESKRAIGDNSNDIPPSKQQNKNPSDQGNPLTSYRYQSSYESKRAIGDNSNDIPPSNINQAISNSNKKGV